MVAAHKILFVQCVDPKLESEQPEQLPVIYLKSLAEPPIDQSIYGSDWSVAQLINKFSKR